MASAQPFGRQRGFVYASAPRTPDEWIVVAAETFVALIEAGAGVRGIDALTEAARSDRHSIEAIVSAIPTGDGGVDSFAIVHLDEAGRDGWQVTAIARGRAVVDVYSVGGSRRFSSSGVQPWLIATFRDVVAVELAGPSRRFDAVPHRAPTALPLGLGAAHAGSLLWSVAPAERSDAPACDADVDYVRSATGPDDDTVRRVRDEQQSSAAPAGSNDSAATIEGSGSPTTTSFGAGATGQTGSPADTGTQVETGTRAETRVPIASGIPDDETVERRRSTHASAPPDHSSARPDDENESGGEGVLRVLVGIRGHDAFRLDAPIVFGRRPSGSRRFGVDPVLVVVPSPEQVVSASHVRVERSGRVVVVTDLRSRNGTTVTVPGVGTRRLRPGESFAVPGAAAVEIGDGTIIDITPEAR